MLVSETRHTWMPITDSARKILWARSGNRCALCRAPLVESATPLDAAAVVGVECHIFPQGKDGPRSDAVRPDDVHAYPNLILLCGKCHKVVDTQVHTYSQQALHDRRASHEAWVHTALTEHSPAVVDAAEHVQSNEWGDGDSILPNIESDESFAMRLSDAFPGSSGLSVISDPTLALARLAVVLREPLHQWLPGDIDGPRRVFPFWWFRGSLCTHISAFRQLGPSRCLVDVKELVIKRVAAFRRPYHSMWDFLYVESAADEATGVYAARAGDPPDRSASALWGSYEYEEVALWKGRFIAREDYEDGATLVDGKPTRVEGAEIRQKYLTPYNFIICGNRHVINENVHDAKLNGLLDAILKETGTVNELAEFIDALPKPLRYFSSFD